MSERIIIIDGNSLINRAYYAMQKPMITKNGIYTQGIFGFINMLNKIIGDYEPAYLTVAFDLKAPTFRHLEYDAYKAGRKPMPPELVMQMPLLKEVLAAMRIKTLELEGYEADDIIGNGGAACRRGRYRASDHYRRQGRAAAGDRQDKDSHHQKRNLGVRFVRL